MVSLVAQFSSINKISPLNSNFIYLKTVNIRTHQRYVVVAELPTCAEVVWLLLSWCCPLPGDDTSSRRGDLPDAGCDVTALDTQGILLFALKVDGNLREIILHVTTDSILQQKRQSQSTPFESIPTSNVTRLLVQHKIAIMLSGRL